MDSLTQPLDRETAAEYQAIWDSWRAEKRGFQHPLPQAATTAAKPRNYWGAAACDCGRDKTKETCCYRP